MEDPGAHVLRLDVEIFRLDEEHLRSQQLRYSAQKDACHTSKLPAETSMVHLAQDSRDTSFSQVHRKMIDLTREDYHGGLVCATPPLLIFLFLSVCKP